MGVEWLNDFRHFNHNGGFQVTKEDHKSFRDLVWHLIYARDIQNELEKAR